MNDFYSILIEMDSYLSRSLVEDVSYYDNTMDDLLEEASKLSQSLESKLRSSKALLKKYKEPALACNPVGLHIKTSLNSIKKQYKEVIKIWEDAAKYYEKQESVAKSEGNQYDVKNNIYKYWNNTYKKYRDTVKSNPITSEDIAISKQLIKEACNWLKNDFGSTYRTDQTYSKRSADNLKTYDKFSKTDNKSERIAFNYKNLCTTNIMTYNHYYANMLYGQYKKILVAAANYNPRNIKESNLMIDEFFMVNDIYDYYDITI